MDWGVPAHRGSGWGATPAIFDDADADTAEARGRVQALMSEEDWAAARRTVLNAHYTDPAVAGAMWSALTGLGFGGGRVLEPGCGSFRSPSVSHPAECLDMLRVRSTRSPSGFPWSGGRSPFSSGILLEWEP
jgi:hypothetical protein